MTEAIIAPDVVYSHDDVWLLVHNMYVMKYAKDNNLLLWQHFVDKVQMETGEVYIDDWDLNTIINKMADDLGSYKLLVNIWLHQEDAINNLSDAIDN